MPTALKASPATVTQSLAVALTQCTLSAYPASARLSPTATAAVKTRVTTRPAPGQRSNAPGQPSKTSATMSPGIHSVHMRVPGAGDRGTAP